ncbi:MAG TPA: ABC transporter substrate-binding protein [Pseudonocardiaceae bacterium]|jgi:ABC-type branched-subunit amino acid transport system substrate-binding protein|nr:ABC transporter substrate-binding protein [Pseudonocardiaceae bacterium]
MTTATRAKILTVVLTAAALTVAGCAGSPGGASGGSGSTILVGEIAGTTGAYGTTGQAMVNGAQLAIDDLNAAGGALGKKYSFQWYNDEASATTSSQLFRKLVSAGAVAIAGSGDTGPTTAAESDRAKIPNVGVVDDGGLTVYPKGPSNPPYSWVFDTGLNTFAWGGAVAQYALKNCTGLALLHDPSSYGLGGEAGIKTAYQAGGKQLTVDDAITENWSTGATVGLTSEIDKIKTSGADCVDVWLTPQDQAAFVQQAKSLGANLTVLGNDETDADSTFSDLAKGDADGVVSALLSTEVQPNAKLAAFQQKYQARFKVASTPFAEASYDAIIMLGAAIKSANSTKPADLQKALNAVSGFDGLTGTLSFTPQKHTTIGPEQLTIVKFNGTDKKWEPIGNQ